MHMIGHQAVGPDLNAGSRRRIGQEIEIERIVSVLEEGLLTPIAPLRHMVRDARKDDAR